MIVAIVEGIVDHFRSDIVPLVVTSEQLSYAVTLRVINILSQIYQIEIYRQSIVNRIYIYP